MQRGSRRFFSPLQPAETARCVAEGLPVKGYFYWSLTDSYEWGSYQPCFGLYSYEFEDGRIGESGGLEMPAGSVYAELAAALKSGDEGRIAEAFTP